MIKTDHNQYQNGLMGQYRLYMDRAAAFFYWTNICGASFLVLNLALLFVTVDKPFSPALLLAITVVGGVFAAVTGLVQVYRGMQSPRLPRTLGWLLFMSLCAPFPLVTLCTYVIACLIERQIHRRSIGTFLHVFVGPYLLMLLLIFGRFFLQGRYIPSTSMMPTLQIGDRIMTENISSMKGEPLHRGQIVVFSPPSGFIGLEKHGLLETLGDLTGLPGFPSRPAFIKRVVGLPGDRIEIRAGEGVFINGIKTDEKGYLQENANYNLKVLSDIGGRSTSGALFHPYDKSEPIVVPPNMVFLLGDNRNSSEDSHVFGFVDQHRIIGRAWLLWYPEWSYMHEANWRRPEK